MIKISREADTPFALPLSMKVIGPISVLTAIIYFFSNPKPGSYYDYTFCVAGRLLGGGVGFGGEAANVADDVVPFDGAWYSVFPLGAVVSIQSRGIERFVGFI